MSTGKAWTSLYIWREGWPWPEDDPEGYLSALDDYYTLTEAEADARRRSVIWKLVAALIRREQRKKIGSSSR